MGLISGTVGLPLLPVRGVIALARTVQRQAGQEHGSAASLRRRLEAVEQAHADSGDPDGGDPDTARLQAQQIEQILGEVVPPAPVLPAAGSDAGPPPGARRTRPRRRGR